MTATIRPLIVANDRAAIKAARTKAALPRWERIVNHTARSWIRARLWGLEQDERRHFRAINRIRRKRAQLAAAMSAAPGAKPCHKN